MEVPLPGHIRKATTIRVGKNEVGDVCFFRVAKYKCGRDDSLVVIGQISPKEFLLAGVELEEIVVREDEEEVTAPPPTPKEKPDEIRALAEIEANSVAAYNNPISFVPYNRHNLDNAKSTAIEAKNTRQEKAALAVVARLATAKTVNKKEKGRDRERPHSQTKVWWSDLSRTADGNNHRWRLRTKSDARYQPPGAPLRARANKPRLLPPKRRSRYQLQEAASIAAKRPRSATTPPFRAPHRRQRTALLTFDGVETTTGKSVNIRDRSHFQQRTT
jgi:hypothetical protein